MMVVLYKVWSLKIILGFRRKLVLTVNTVIKELSFKFIFVITF